MEADVVRSFISNSVWRYIRRTFTGVVLIYVLTCWILYEKSSARTTLHFLVGLWIVIQLCWIGMERWRAHRSQGTGDILYVGRTGVILGRASSFLGLIAFNLAL